MKEPSKLDQARAMREARYTVDSKSPALIAGPPLTINGKPIIRAEGPLVAGDLVPGAVVRIDPELTRQKFAPPGECPYCDRQRGKAADAVRLHRAKQKPV